MKKKYEPQLTQNSEPEEIAETIVRLAANYRAPYVAIIGFSEALLEGLSGDLNPTQVADIQSIRTSGWQALGNLNDILDVMLIMSGQIEYEKLSVDFSQLLRDVVRDVERTRPEGSQPLQTELLQTPVYIEGDEARLRQALLGLIANTMVSLPRTQVQLKVKVDDQHLEITICDGCAAANNDDLTYFFEAGWVSKMKNGRWRQMQWQSYLAHHFVVAHQGQIWVEPIEAEGDTPAGTQIVMRLPIAKPEDSPQAD
ncbi:MAG: HAMP domain-containing histidine kinase [Anaerolineales bacterium]|nr:HAMP domain-containing histidine kinase [Anaerolineales bacterium]